MAFYRDVLGMKAGSIYPAKAGRERHCFIRPGEVETWGIHFFESPDAVIYQSKDAMERLRQDPYAEDLNRFLPGALQHIAFSVASEEEALAHRSKLDRMGVPMTEIYDQGAIRDYIFLDNNGIQIEVAWPKAGSA